MKKRILGLIPARGGSKGVPRKNIKNLCGKPLVAYTLIPALKSRFLTDVVVSTEDEEIAQIAVQYGGQVPFLRPAELARDNSSSLDAVIHAVNSLKEKGKDYDAICLLQPTNPFRSVELIDTCIEKFISSNADSLVSVREVPHQFNPHWVFFEDNGNGYLKISTGEKHIITRRQELPKSYYRDGSIYLTWTKTLLDHNSLYGQKILWHEISHDAHVNIDTIEDWKEAERILCLK